MLFKRILKALIVRKILNNAFFNYFYILLGLDKKIQSFLHPYIDFIPTEKQKKLQEIAGYSDRPEINEVLTIIHDELNIVKNNSLHKDDNVLDIGCGPGLYLKDFGTDFQLTGIDISSTMVSYAQNLLPHAEIIKGDFLKHDFGNKKFNFIYSVGVLIYINRSELNFYFKKTCGMLKKDGIFFLSYPHAISLSDLFYPDLQYIQYSPRRLEQMLKKSFNIIKHEHVFDKRKINFYDSKPYKSLNPDTDRTYKNSSLLIAQKK